MIDLSTAEYMNDQWTDPARLPDRWADEQTQMHAAGARPAIKFQLSCTGFC